MFAACPMCRRVVESDSPTELVNRHNEEMHDGDGYAIVVSGTENGLNMFEEHGKDVLNDGQYEQLINYLVKKDPWGIR